MARCRLALLVVALLGAACAPALDLDNPCDEASAAWDPCNPACHPCPSGSACRVVQGVAECVCDTGWCVKDKVCCAATLACFEDRCCTRKCTADYLCGDDGCGGSCGLCPGCGEVCLEGRCLFDGCAGRECGPNACGGGGSAACGTCPSGKNCSVDGRCTDV